MKKLMITRDNKGRLRSNTGHGLSFIPAGFLLASPETTDIITVFKNSDCVYSVSSDINDSQESLIIVAMLGLETATVSKENCHFRVVSDDSETSVIPYGKTWNRTMIVI